MAQFYGQSGDATINSVAMHITKWSGKYTSGKADVSNASTGGWIVELPGGMKQFTGECEFIWDSSINVAATGLPVPFSDTQVTFSLALGGSTKTISFTGQVYDMSFDNELPKPISCKCSFSSSGVVTYA